MVQKKAGSSKLTPTCKKRTPLLSEVSIHFISSLDGEYQAAEFCCRSHVCLLHSFAFATLHVIFTSLPLQTQLPLSLLFPMWIFTFDFLAMIQFRAREILLHVACLFTFGIAG
jgi:hypothetical protein